MLAKTFEYDTKTIRAKSIIYYASILMTRFQVDSLLALNGKPGFKPQLRHFQQNEIRKNIYAATSFQ